jgi:hypothetical protein
MAISMKRCLIDFNNKVIRLYTRSVELHNTRVKIGWSYNILDEDLLFAGLVYNGYKIFRHPLQGYIGVYDNKASLEVDLDYSFEYASTNDFAERFHRYLRDNYYFRAHQMKSEEFRKLTSKTLTIILDSVYEKSGEIIVRCQATHVFELAKRYGLPEPSIAWTTSMKPFAIDGFLKIRIGQCELQWSKMGRIDSFGCSDEMLSSEGLCEVLDAIYNILKCAVDTYQEVIEGGTRLLSIAILY